MCVRNCTLRVFWDRLQAPCVVLEMDGWMAHRFSTMRKSSLEWSLRFITPHFLPNLILANSYPSASAPLSSTIWREWRLLPHQVKPAIHIFSNCRKALTALLRIRELTDAYDWQVLLWLTGKRVCHPSPPSQFPATDVYSGFKLAISQW